VLIVSLLVGHVALMVSFAVIASGDPSFGVEPDYYEKALDWDRTRALMREPSEDGFALSTTLTPTTRDRGELRLVLRRADAPVSGVRLKAAVFHLARARHWQTVELTERGAGLYGADVDLERDGLWEVRYEMTTAERTYQFTRRLVVEGAGR